MARAVLFDMDGILAFTEGFYNQRRVDYLEGQGFSFDRVPDFSGNHDEAIWKALVPDDPRLRERLHAGYLEYSEIHPTPWASVANPSALPTFMLLHSRGIKIAICSSSRRDLIDQFMCELELGDLVDLAISGEECAEYKPAPDIYLRAMTRLGVRPDDTIVVEDSPAGILAGRRSGALTCALRAREGIRLDQSAADILIDELVDVVALASSGGEGSLPMDNMYVT